MTNKTTQAKGIQWNTLSSVGLFFVQFSVSYYLNKIVSPNEFGPALWAFFLIQAGLSLSHFSWFDVLVRENKPLNKSHYSTGFIVSATSNLILFAIFFFGANKIATFTQDFNASSHLKLYSILFLTQIVAFIPLVKLTKQINFKTISQINIASKVISSIIAITLALQQLPYWSLFALYVGSQTLTNVFLFTAVRYLPNFCWNKTYATQHFNLASTLTFQKFSSVIGDTLDTILIGKNYLKAEVASYTKSYGLKSMPISSVARSVTKVTFPSLANNQNNYKEFFNIYTETQRFLGFLLFPIYALLFCLAKPFAIAYFSIDWDITTIVKLLQIFSIAGAFSIFQSHFESIFTIKGNPKIITAITVVQRIIFIALLVFSLPKGIVAVAIAKLLSTIFDFILFVVYTHQLLFKRYYNSLIDLLQPLIISATAGVIAFYSLQLWHQQKELIQFLFSSVVFGVLYLALSFLFNKKGIQLLQQNILNRF